ncbi:MAG TPA: ATP-binding cassette domain-containing protein [Spirochaetota bacterium]|nr:ATP-binding cassette domain-containing protein [Spirochaetota bacterium]HOR45256.1 ATP-binding cassette domain-containing protein [Spirochaetota bacterium]
MLNVSNLTFRFSKEPLFKDVNIKFTPGNCYGLIGANGSGKSTFLKILSGELEQSEGEIQKNPKHRMAVLKQNQFEYDECTVLDTVIMGYKKLYDIMKERELLYSKEELTEKEGMRASELEEEFGEMNGYEAETEAAQLLDGLGVPEDSHYSLMKDLEPGIKVRVLLAQALFGNPDILLLDEPTNYLDLETVKWLENFLEKFENTVVVVSHDRHFLDRVCTHIADIDYGKIELYSGNYSFWFEASQLALRQKRDENKKTEDKRKELLEFIQRFSSNASKSKQATARKKMLEKLNVEDIKPSSRRFPYVAFKPERECGKTVLEIEKLNYPSENLKDFSLLVNRNDKIVFLGDNKARTALFQIINGEIEAESGEFKWGETISRAYFQKENTHLFSNDLNIIDWLRQYSDDKDENFLRSFLGRMLFSGDDSFKKVKVLSGGEKVRCMISKLMLSNANCLILDEPTNHLDLESITALNNALISFPGVVLFAAHDHKFIETVSNRVVEFTPNGIIDRVMNFEDYLDSDDIKTLRDKMYGNHDGFVL